MLKYNIFLQQNERYEQMKKIAILTGGGDCPGLNAVIRAVVYTAITKYNLEETIIKGPCLENLY